MTSAVDKYISSVMADDFTPMAVLQAPWKWHSDRKRYEIVSQVKEIYFCDRGVARLNGETWEVIERGWLDEAVDFCASAVPPKAQ